MVKIARVAVDIADASTACISFLASASRGRGECWCSSCRGSYLHVTFDLTESSKAACTDDGAIAVRFVGAGAVVELNLAVLALGT